MGRPPDGSTRKDRTRTAVFAHIAARLHDWPSGRDTDFFRDVLGIDMNATAAQKACSRIRYPSTEKQPPGPAPIRSDPVDDPEPTDESPPALRRWLLVEEPKLDLDAALLRFAPSNQRQTGVLAGLRATVGVRQIIELAGTWEVLAVVVFDGARARRTLKAVVQERTGQDPAWFDIEMEDWSPSRETWVALAQASAEQEGLRLIVPVDSA
ncbi:MAG TPA: hypothetical protein VN238_11470 [Solirubrobacteraceae bacterium]|nr:hypothetical protein [Solirubrobacteraceae bacterium]